MYFTVVNATFVSALIITMLSMCFISLNAVYLSIIWKHINKELSFTHVREAHLGRAYTGLLYRASPSIAFLRNGLAKSRSELQWFLQSQDPLDLLHLSVEIHCVAFKTLLI